MDRTGTRSHPALAADGEFQAARQPALSKG